MSIYIYIYIACPRWSDGSNGPLGVSWGYDKSIIVFYETNTPTSSSC